MPRSPSPSACPTASGSRSGRCGPCSSTCSSYRTTCRQRRSRRSIRSWLDQAGDVTPDRTAELLAATIGAGEAELADRVGALLGVALDDRAGRPPAPAAARRRGPPLVERQPPRPRRVHPPAARARCRSSWSRWPGRSCSIAGRPGAAASGTSSRSPSSLSATTRSRRSSTYLLDGSGPAIVSSVVARADGNPFYAGEIVRSIIERVPDLTDDAAVQAGLAALPDTVQATILARLDTLPAADRRLLQLGSVLGRTFRMAGIFALEPDLAAYRWPAPRRAARP